MFDMTNTAHTATETVRLAVLSTLIEHGFRWITSNGSGFLPRGTVVVSRSGTMVPVAYVWKNGTVSVFANLTGSLVRGPKSEPRDVIPAEKFAEYLTAAGTATRDRAYLSTIERTRLYRKVMA